MLYDLLKPFSIDFNILLSQKIYLAIILIYTFYSSYTDFKSFIIPQKISFAMIILRLLLIPIYGFSLNNLIGCLVPFFLFWTIAAILNKSMGGDIKFIGAIGLWLGINIMLVNIFLSCVIALIFVFITKLLKFNNKGIAYALFFNISFLITIVTMILVR